MCEYFCQERDLSKEVPRARLQKKKRQECMGQRQLESPAREFLEQAKCCNDADCTHR